MKINRQFKKKFHNAGVKLTALDQLKTVVVKEQQPITLKDAGWLDLNLVREKQRV